MLIKPSAIITSRIKDVARSMHTLEIHVGKTIFVKFQAHIVFCFGFLAFLYVFLAPILFFTILHFPSPQVARDGKCRIVKNKIGARKTYKNAKNTKTKNNMSMKFNKNRFPDTLSDFS